MKNQLILLFSLLISFNSYGLFKKTVCVETETVRRGGLIYLPNKTKPFTGNDLCIVENGQILKVGKIKRGKFVSQTFNFYYENGKIKQELGYKDGREDGKSTWWYENGQKWKDENYKDGKLDGKATWWYENGQIEAEGYAKDDKPHGKVTQWDRNGKITSESTYKDGECISGDCPK